MIKITLQEVIDSVPARWKQQYANRGTAKQYEITELLKQLTPPLKAEELNKIIGNSSWTVIRCNECKKDVDTVIELGDEPSVYVCVKCLKAALKLGK